MFRLTDKTRKRTSVAGMLALGVFSLMFLTGGTQPDKADSLAQSEKSEYDTSNIQLVQFGQVEQQSVDMGVNPFVETAAQNGASPKDAGNKGGNYRNLPAIPAVYPTSQPRPMLPLPSIPRAAAQNQPVAPSAPVKAVETAPAENKEARIAFLGGGDIMFAHGTESSN